MRSGRVERVMVISLSFLFHGYGLRGKASADE